MRKGKWQPGDDAWSISFQETEALISLLYGRGVYGVPTLTVKTLQSRDWGPHFYHDTMSRNEFWKMMNFIRFDITPTRSQ